MPRTPGVGASNHSAQKQRDFRAVLSRHLDIVKSIAWNRPYIIPNYFYLDLTAGPGEHPYYGDGSPVIFIQEASQRKIDWSATFIEKDPKAADNLRRLTGANYDGSSRVICADHNTVNGDLCDEYRAVYQANGKKRLMGMIYADANGLPPFDMLTWLSKEPWTAMMDVLTYLPATVIKRCLSVHDKRLSDYLEPIQKKHWLVRNPAGKWQWTFLLGTNWTGFPELQSHGFYDVDSETGQAILGRLNLTNSEWTPPYRNYKEYCNHPRFKEAKAAVFERANGTCEMCHDAKATDPHHLSYPPWGAFDLEPYDNIVALCHSCHCDVHGKEQ